MMREGPRFWKALDDIPGAASDTRDWKMRLGEEFDTVSRYLRRTGEIATSVDCPSPGGDGCPRRVVRLPGGILRGICGSSPSGCDAIELTYDDLAIRALDYSILAGDLVRALDATQIVLVSGNWRVVVVGRYDVAAGVAAPVILAVPGPRDPLSDEELYDAGLDRTGSAVLVPGPSSLPTHHVARLQAAGHQILALSEIVGFDEDGKLVGLQSPAVLLSGLRHGYSDRLTAVRPTPAWALPSNSRWSELTFRLTSSEEMTVNFRGNGRTFVPSDLGMMDRKTKQGDKNWGALQLLARGSGSVPVPASGKRNTLQKRMQLLGRILCSAFCLGEDPIPAVRGESLYRARFVISDERPLMERDPSRRR